MKEVEVERRSRMSQRVWLRQFFCFVFIIAESGRSTIAQCHASQSR